MTASSNPFSNFRIPAPTAVRLSELLPRCPVCSAKALAYWDTRYDGWDKIEFDCDCASKCQDSRFNDELQRLWRERQALPAFLHSLPEGYRNYTLDNFPLHIGVQDAYNVARLRLNKSIYIYGDPGVGKTHLMVAAARRYAEAGRITGYVSVPQYFDQLMRVRDGGPPPAPLTSYDVLVLDDVDKVRRYDGVFNHLYVALEHFQTSPKKVLLVTAQAHPSDVAVRVTPQGDEVQAAAFASRLATGHLRQVFGQKDKEGFEMDFRFAAADREAL